MKPFPGRISAYLVSVAMTLLVISFSACSSKPTTEEPVSGPEIELPPEPEAPVPEKPRTAKKETSPFDALKGPPAPILLDHKWFKIQYDREYRLPRYVVYTVTATSLRKKVAKRRDPFRADPQLIAKHLSAVALAEYKDSHYDRGHMAPSADFAFSQEAQDETFVLSNMAPQKANLNQDAWRRLELKVRAWACGEEKVTVITGPILQAGLPKLKSGLAVPDEFFKIVIDETAPRKALGFIYNQKDKGDLAASRVVAVSAIAERVPSLKGLYGNEFNSQKPDMNSWKVADCNPPRAKKKAKAKARKSK